jgi:hypothetical protein
MLSFDQCPVVAGSVSDARELDLIMMVERGAIFMRQQIIMLSKCPDAWCFSFLKLSHNTRP